MKKVISLVCLLGLASYVLAGWSTHFSYQNVTEIAASEQEVYGLASGSLFSVNKKSEKLTLYSSLTGLHSTQIVKIYYDQASKKLIVAYNTGKIDLITAHGVEFISDLYTKDMVYSKRCNNITVHGSMAYLAMPFGLVSFDMYKHEFVNTYFIGDEAKEVDVEDVIVVGDSLYAFTSDLIYSGALKDNLMDYRNWKNNSNNTIKRDTNKGILVSDSNGDTWQAGGSNGIVRTTPTGEKINYCPQGPASNIPYQLRIGANDRLYMIEGGRWDVKYYREASVMVYDNNTWTHIPRSDIQRATGIDYYVRDLINIAEDPTEPGHFYANSYGMGVYEFRNMKPITCFNHYNSPMDSRLPDSDSKDAYDLTGGGVFDQQGNYIFVSAAISGKIICIRDKNGTWNGVNPKIDGEDFFFTTPGEIIIDQRNRNRKYIVSCRYNPGLLMWDDNGTLLNEKDDRCTFRQEWIDQNGNLLNPNEFYTVFEDREGNIWVGTRQGVIIIPTNIDFAESNLCERIQIEQKEGDFILTDDEVHAITQDIDGNIWVGTKTYGVYVLSEDRQQLLAHYTQDNSPMPTNYVMSLAASRLSDRVFIGTSNGLVSYSALSTRLYDDGIQNDEQEINGIMGQWRLHNSYTILTQVVDAQDKVYALANGALFSVNKQDETIETYDKTTGLNGGRISKISYNEKTGKLLIIYSDGQIDIIKNDYIDYMPDLYLKASELSMELSVNDIHMQDNIAYIGMNFGILAINMQRQEVKDVYYIGQNASDINVLGLTIATNDSLYAIDNNTLYVCSTKDNLIDFSFWKNYQLPVSTTNSNIASIGDSIFLLQDSLLYLRTDTHWQRIAPNYKFYGMKVSQEGLLLFNADSGMMLLNDEEQPILLNYYNGISDACRDAYGTYWMVANRNGILRSRSGHTSYFMPNGPYDTNAFRMTFSNDGKLFVAPGGRWASKYYRPAHVMMYENHKWSACEEWRTSTMFDLIMRDLVSYAIDPQDNSHFYAATYGMGVLEFKNNQPFAHYTYNNSTLSTIVASAPDYYCMTDGLILDDNNTLWVLNAGTDVDYPINLKTKEGNWYGLDIVSNGQRITLTTPGEILVDKRNPDWKWLIDQRSSTGIILVIDDGHTDGMYRNYRNASYALKRNSFVDTNGNLIAPNEIYCLAQDKNNNIWVGTNSGLFIIEAATDFRTSNQVRKVLINRNDGSGLADYLLDSEQINSIAIDGANRKWIGTQTSGIFVISDDISATGIETVAHFTADNSSLPSSEIIYIAINHISGEVFAATAAGIASYQSDASQAQETMDKAYAYPNPVRQNFVGQITITGLMDNTTVTIIDANGQTICKTRSNGGTAVWDGKDQHGRRAATGVYSALCNAGDGKGHTVVKIMVIN